MEADKTLPLRDGASNLVFGEGSPNAKIYFLGEAPGFYEDKTGRPFVGAAGRLLDSLFDEIGIKREDVFISNMIGYRPPNNRDPKPAEIEAFTPYVDKRIEIIAPKIIITLGRFSLNKFLPGVKISAVHGKIFKIKWQGTNRILIPMYHPAAAFRRDETRKRIKEDFQVIKKVLV